MSISAKLEKLETDLTNAYNAVNNKGGTIPQNKNTENLSNAINSITSGYKPTVPEEYQEVEYIGASGTQYISIPNIKVNNTTYAKLKVYAQDEYVSDTQCSLLGIGTYHSGFFLIKLFKTSGNSGKFRGWYSNDWDESWNIDVDNLDQPHYIELKKNKIYFDDTLVYTSSSSYSASGSLCLLAENSSNRGYSKIGRVETKGYNNFGTLIPCYRKQDNVAGFYNVDNDTFYTNQGTGTFIVGPEI